MADFEQKITHVSGLLSVREQLRQWLVPQHYQGYLRMHRSILVNGAYIPISATIPADATIELHYTGTNQSYLPSNEPIPVVYEDDQLLIVNKPAGIKTHPSSEYDTDTAMNRISNYLHAPVYITHRLDMETSGLLLVCKDPMSGAIINRQLATRRMHREYTALCGGIITGSGTITAPIAHAPNDERRRMVSPTGLAAITHYRCVGQSDTYTRVHLQLETGRTHQIRVHLASIGAPIVGDPLYGNIAGNRLYLHADTMEFTHPFTNKLMHISAPAAF
ncbi:RluA family pseudouridine synthase [Lacticaseibacillus zhaodongensis]|uniref:RluA family pseudouridine synthase n=1 Tax=Lacticaseibacillus zhaodongensis TaxID=2668065 RepID=UPI001E548BDD|nr:RluA family pseudouridine synthase [Lacticaseibacillus zhaodongensis]